MGLNILRVWRAVEIVSEEMRHDGVLPMEDKLAKSKVNLRVEVEKETAVGLEMVREEF